MSVYDDQMKAWLADGHRRGAKSSRNDARQRLALCLLCVLPTLGWYVASYAWGNLGLRGATRRYWSLLGDPFGWDLATAILLTVVGVPLVISVALYLSARRAYQGAAQQQYIADTLSGNAHRSWLKVAGLVVGALLAPAGAIIAALLIKGWLDPHALAVAAQHFGQLLLRLW